HQSGLRRPRLQGRDQLHQVCPRAPARSGRRHRGSGVRARTRPRTAAAHDQPRQPRPGVRPGLRAQQGSQGRYQGRRLELIWFRRPQRDARDQRPRGRQLGEERMAPQLDFKELQELAAEILGIEPDAVQLDKSFAKDLAADSLDLVELIAAVEDKYDVELPEEELEKMKLIGDLWKFLEQKTAERLEA